MHTSAQPRNSIVYDVLELVADQVARLARLFDLRRELEVI